MPLPACFITVRSQKAKKKPLAVYLNIPIWFCVLEPWRQRK